VAAVAEPSRAEPDNPFDAIMEALSLADSIDAPEVYERVSKLLAKLFKLELPQPAQQLLGGRGGATLVSKLVSAAEEYQEAVTQAVDAANRRSPVMLKRALVRAARHLRAIWLMSSAPAAAARAEAPLVELEATDVVAECGAAAAALLAYIASRGEVDRHRLYEYCVESGINPARAARALECLISRGRVRVVVKNGLEHYTLGW
jgi:hypothetical protein